MNKIAHLLRTNRYLNIFASVKLAVPLMIVLIIVVATGTIFESLYNSDYAKMAVYQTGWFLVLLSLLWVNILCAALSRWPYKIHHLGFVVTHAGMLTLMIGAFVTSLVGLDAQLGINEGSANATMVLPETVLGYQFADSQRPQMIEIPRGLSSYEANKDSSLNSSIKHMFWVKRYIPFSTASRVVVPTNNSQAAQGVAAGVGVSFRMKSKFFEVSEWMHSLENPTMSLGPAKLELKVGHYGGGAEGGGGGKKAAPAKKSARKAASEAPAEVAPAAVTPGPRSPQSEGDTIRITDFKTQKVLGEKSAAELTQHAWSIGGVQVKIKKVYRFAMVGSNKLAEGTGPEPNPAYEFEVVKGGETKREVLFVRFANFSINPNGVFGLRISLGGANAPTGSPEMMAAHGGGATAGMGSAADSGAETGAASAGDVNNHGTTTAHATLPAGHPNSPEAEAGAGETPPAGAPPPMGAGRNVIQFWVDPDDKEERAEVVLQKDGQFVGREMLNAGQTYQTPWMGMQLTLASVVRGGQSRVVAEPTEPTKGKNLPPSAIEIQLADGSDRFWLTEGTSQQVNLLGRQAQIFFDRRTLDLPFQLKLEKFTKKDYPGTETPMSYESLVELPSGQKQVISMNDPLKKDGFTIYQSSYVIEEGKVPESIFSVNDDPGRPIKYIGAIILALGIITFTVQRSEWWLQRNRIKKAA